MITSKIEIKHFLISALVLTLVFAFNDKRKVFELAYWLINFLKIFILVFISLLFHTLGHKIAAKKAGSYAEHRIWSIGRYWYSTSAHFPLILKIGHLRWKIKSFWIGVFLPLIFTIFSNGIWYIPLTESFQLFNLKYTRVKQKFKNITEYELAKIALAGPLGNVFLILIFKILNSSSAFDQIILINSLIAVFSIIPLPGLDGIKIFCGSKSLFGFGVAFILCFVFLIQVLSLLPALILSVVLALILGAVYFYFKVYEQR